MTRTRASRLLALTATSAVVASSALAIAAPAHGAAETCVGTVKVTDTYTGESLGRFTGDRRVSTDETTWLRLTPDAAVLAGEIGDLLIADSTGGTYALGGTVGGLSDAPYDEMTPGTGDNVYFEAGGTGVPTSAATEAFAYVSEFWSLADSGELTVVWTQPNGGVLPMAGYLSSYPGSAADFGAFASELGGDATQVSYTFVPNAGLESACSGDAPLSITAEVTSESPANEAGWYRTPATVTYTCEGGTAPLDCPDPVIRDNTRPGFELARKVTDANGQETKVRTLLQVDPIGPILKFTGIAAGPYDRKARPVNCTAVDKNSGVDQECAVTYGKIVQGSQGGATRRWTATATDVAGNTSTVTRAFRVKS